MTAPYKGTGPTNASYAKGGAVIKEGRSIFMKQPDVFREDKGPGARQDYGGKKDPLSVAKGDTKCLTPVKPKS
jgi:hypothetical protein